MAMTAMNPNASLSPLVGSQMSATANAVAMRSGTSGNLHRRARTTNAASAAATAPSRSTAEPASAMPCMRISAAKQPASSRSPQRAAKLRMRAPYSRTGRATIGRTGDRTLARGSDPESRSAARKGARAMPSVNGDIDPEVTDMHRTAIAPVATAAVAVAAALAAWGTFGETGDQAWGDYLVVLAII